MKLPWAEIEELPFRVDVGSTYTDAMSSAIPANVMCFTTDGRIVLNGVTFGGASSITINGVSYTFNSSNGSITLPMAGDGVDGMMSGSDKAKLDTIQEGAEVNLVKNIVADGDIITIATKDSTFTMPSLPWANWINNSISGITEELSTCKSQISNNTERISSLENYKQQTENNRVDIQDIYQELKTIKERLQKLESMDFLDEIYKSLTLDYNQ